MPLQHEVEQEAKAEEEKKLRLAYSNVFAGVDGDKVLKDLITFCYVFGQTLHPGVPDVTAYREGKRAVGMRILIMSGRQAAMMEAIGL